MRGNFIENESFLTGSHWCMYLLCLLMKQIKLVKTKTRFHLYSNEKKKKILYSGGIVNINTYEAELLRTILQTHCNCELLRWEIFGGLVFILIQTSEQDFVDPMFVINYKIEGLLLGIWQTYLRCGCQTTSPIRRLRHWPTPYKIHTRQRRSTVNLRYFIN